MDLEKAVIVMSSSGEQLLGEMGCTREDFHNDASRGLAVEMANVRRFDVRHVASGDPMRPKVQIMFNLAPIEPFPYPVKMHVRLTRWVFISDVEDDRVKNILQDMLRKAETQEQQMRAAASGIHLPGSLPGNLKGV